MGFTIAIIYYIMEQTDFQGEKGAKTVNAVGIIAEYDPFHQGHAYQIRKVRELGAQAVAVCMSGDLVQRGTAALLPPWVRARAALEHGADLVLELPNPCACLSAEGFAQAGVALLSALPMLDTLAFGAEQADTASIKTVAQVLTGTEFSKALAKSLATGCSFAWARAAAAESVLPGSTELLAMPNNNLGIEYCRAIESQKSHLQPVALQREGADHGQITAGENGFASAGFLRNRWQQGGARALEGYVPKAALALYEKEAAQAMEARLWDVALLSRLRGLTPEEISATRGTGEGLENLLASRVQNAGSLQELYDGMKSKRYAHARLRRYVLDAALGYTNEIPRLPPYLHMLAANERGLALLKGARLPADASLAKLARENSACAAMARAHAAGADLAALCRKKPQPMGQSYTRPPYILA